MSVGIVFSDGTDWFKANWVFRQLAEDATSRHRDDDGIRNALEEALALGCLDLKKMDGELRRRVTEALKQVADGTVSGTIKGWRPHDQRGHAMYCKALSELAKLIEKQRAGGPTFPAPVS